MNPMQDLVDVVISGLGPTGMTLAHLLGQRGFKVVVLEREPEFYGNARAVYTDDECLRIFQSMGIAQELASDMLQDAAVQLVLMDGSVLAQLKDPNRPYGWSPNNFLYQPLLETTLAQTLSRYPLVEVRRGREVVSFAQDAEGVTVVHAATKGLQYGRTSATETVTGAKPTVDQGDVQQVRAKYFVACDGGRSTVRAQLGVEMEGKSFPNPWLVVDLKAKDPQDGLNHLPYFNFICDPKCPTVNCVQPYGHHRFEFMLMPGQTREYMEDPATIRNLVSRHVDAEKFDVLRSLVYTFNALIASKWREGRVFLAGDAAHMTPQFVGQGMNAGIRDAYNLAWKLSAVLKGQAGEKLLDTYQRERHPHVRAMIKAAVDMKSFVSVANPVMALLRNILTRAALATPKLARLYVRPSSFRNRNTKMAVILDCLAPGERLREGCCRNRLCAAATASRACSTICWVMVMRYSVWASILGARCVRMTGRSGSRWEPVLSRLIHTAAVRKAASPARRPKESRLPKTCRASCMHGSLAIRLQRATW
jgi:3-(3-hydroxy-phenyl)propionate hydroxylase